jgi:hypothetical protein
VNPLVSSALDAWVSFLSALLNAVTLPIAVFACAIASRHSWGVVGGAAVVSGSTMVSGAVVAGAEVAATLVEADVTLCSLRLRIPPRLP